MAKAEELAKDRLEQEIEKKKEELEAAETVFEKRMSTIKKAKEKRIKEKMRSHHWKHSCENLLEW